MTIEKAFHVSLAIRNSVHDYRPYCLQSDSETPDFVSIIFTQSLYEAFQSTICSWLLEVTKEQAVSAITNMLALQIFRVVHQELPQEGNTKRIYQ